LLSLRSFIQTTRSDPRPFVAFHNNLICTMSSKPQLSTP
jgi:hypothetical protein